MEKEHLKRNNVGNIVFLLSDDNCTLESLEFSVISENTESNQIKAEISEIQLSEIIKFYFFNVLDFTLK